MDMNWDSANTTQLTERCCEEVRGVTPKSGEKEQVSGSQWAASSIRSCEARCGERLSSCL